MVTQCQGHESNTLYIKVIHCNTIDSVNILTRISRTTVTVVKSMHSLVCIMYCVYYMYDM